MRYFVTARVKPGCELELLKSIEAGTLGQGSVAGEEFLHDMEMARVGDDGEVQWVEVCFCSTPLAEERPYWERYFDLISVKDGLARRNCRDSNGDELWACCQCDCTHLLEQRLSETGYSFLDDLRERVASTLP